MIELIIPPAFILLAGALMLPVLPQKTRSYAFIFFSLASLILILTMKDGAILTVSTMNYQLIILKMDALSRVFGIIFAFIATAGGIYSFHIKETGQQCAALLYAGGALGVTFAGDFFTLFIFWEIMAVSSTYLIWSRGTSESQKAGLRYLLFHVLGGGLLFAGILLYLSGPGANIMVTQLKPEMGPGVWLMLLGIIINAAVPPFHAWLSDAYPEATVTGAVFLSAFTTKTAVYVLARVFPGLEILLILGTVMTIYGVVYALLENDIRRILAYHIISQVGYMLAGVGIGTAMAINGAVSHAFSHILYKALLFMGAGVVLHTTGKSTLTEIGGLRKEQPLTFWLYMIAAFSISGFPLFNGFISKSMTVAAAGEAHHEWAMLLMTLAAVGTFLGVGLKLPYFTWLAKDKPADLKVENPPINMHIGMIIVAFFCIFHGLYPKHLYQWLPFPVEWNPFTLHHFVETVQILVFTFIVFWLMRGIITPNTKIALDVDWFYRRPAKFTRKYIVDPWDKSFDVIEAQFYKLAGILAEFGKNPLLIMTKDKKGDTAYSPDRYRPATQTLILTVLGLFIILAIIGLVF